jgi:hypothetical protein
MRTFCAYVFVPRNRMNETYYVVFIEYDAHLTKIQGITSDLQTAYHIFESIHSSSKHIRKIVTEAGRTIVDQIIDS